MQNDMNFIFVKPTLEHCEQIAEEIIKENQKNPHMIAQTAEEMFSDSETADGLSLIVPDGKLIAFIKLKKVLDNFENTHMSIYERGTLFVMSEFRGQGFAKMMIAKLLDNHSDKLIYGVTNVDSVKHILKKL